MAELLVQKSGKLYIKSEMHNSKTELTKAVIDTNIFISGILNDKGAPAKLINHWQNRLFDIVISPAIQEEYKKVFSYINLPSLKVEKVLRLLQKTAIIAKTSEIVLACRDSSDNKFIECAIAGNAKFLVTKNLKHFPKKYKNVKVVSVNNFLNAIGV